MSKVFDRYLGPLVLHECGFENMRIHFQPNVLLSLTQHFEAEWERHAIAATRALNSLEFVMNCAVRGKDVQRLLEDSKGAASLSSLNGIPEDQLISSELRWGDAIARLRLPVICPDDSLKGAYIPLMKVMALFS